MSEELSVRLKADGSGLVGEVRSGSAEIVNLGKSVDQTSDKIAKLNSQQKALLDQFKQSTQGTSDLTKKQVEMGASLDKMLSSIDPSFKAMTRLSEGQDILTRSMQLGLLTQADHDGALKRLTEKYGPAAEGAAGLAGAHGA